MSAPEFFDKALFRGFIQKLRENRIVWTDDAGKLDYDSALEDMVRDARVILARDVRHSILKITPGGDGEKETPEKPLPADATSEALHERHVVAEQHEHAPEVVTVVEESAEQEPSTKQ